jgi:hypothetical protein
LNNSLVKYKIVFSNVIIPLPKCCCSQIGLLLPPTARPLAPLLLWLVQCRQRNGLHRFLCMPSQHKSLTGETWTSTCFFFLLFSSLFQSLGINVRERLPTALYYCGFPRNPHALVLFKKSSSRRPFQSCFSSCLDTPCPVAEYLLSLS